MNGLGNEQTSRGSCLLLLLVAVAPLGDGDRLDSLPVAVREKAHYQPRHLVVHGAKLGCTKFHRSHPCSSSQTLVLLPMENKTFFCLISAAAKNLITELRQGRLHCMPLLHCQRKKFRTCILGAESFGQNSVGATEYPTFVVLGRIPL